MKRSIKTCKKVIAASLCVIVCSGLVNAAVVSGYTGYKNAVRKTAQLKNATAEIRTVFEMEGEYEEEYQIQKIDLQNSDQNFGMAYNKSENHEKFETDKQTIISYGKDEEGITNYYVNAKDGQYTNKRQGLFPAGEEVINLAEIVTDAFIGNLKDYFITSAGNGNKIIQAELDRTMTPNVVNAFMDVITASMNRDISYWNEEELKKRNLEDIYSKLQYTLYREGLRNIYILDGNMYCEIDGDGHITRNDFESNIIFVTNSREIPVKLKLSIQLSDIGETKISLPNFDSEMISIVNRSNNFNPYENPDTKEIFNSLREIEAHIWTLYEQDKTLTGEERLYIEDTLNDIERTINIEQY